MPAAVQLEAVRIQVNGQSVLGWVEALDVKAGKENIKKWMRGEVRLGVHEWVDGKIPDSIEDCDTCYLGKNLGPIALVRVFDVKW